MKQNPFPVHPSPRSQGLQDNLKKQSEIHKKLLCYAYNPYLFIYSV